MKIPSISDLTARSNFFRLDRGRSPMLRSGIEIPGHSDLYPKKKHYPVFETLDNGIKIIAENKLGDITSSLRVLIRVGSVNDDIAGQAHGLEHMVFEGTHNRTEAEVEKLCRKTGIKLNAHTSKCYTEFLVDDLTDDLNIAIELVLDMVFNPLIPNSSFSLKKDSELGIILDEIGLADNEIGPYELIKDELLVKLWNHHPIYREILGNKESVLKLNRENVESFWRRHYTPDNIIVSVSGKCDPRQVIDLIEQLTRKQTAKCQIDPVEELKYTPAALTGKLRSKDRTLLELVAEAPSDSDYLGGCIVDIISTVLDLRAYEKTRMNEKLFYDVGSEYDSNSFAGRVLFGGEVPDRSSMKLLRILVNEIKNIKKEGFTTEEIESAIAIINRQVMGDFGSIPIRAEKNAQMVFLSSRFLPWNERLLNVATIHDEDINSAVNQLFKNLSLIAVGGKNMPKLKELKEVVFQE